MPQFKVSTPQSLEDLCLTVLVRCLETDIVLCEVAKSLSPSSLLLRHINLSNVQIAKELSEYLSFLPGTLSEMVRQEMTTRVIKRYTNFLNARSQTWDTIPLYSLPVHTMTVRLLEIILNEDVQSIDLSNLVPVSRPEILVTRSEALQERDPELWELVLGRCTALRKFCLPLSLSCIYEVNLDTFITSLAIQCNQLSELILKDAVTDGRVLAVLGAYCPSLKILDLTGSTITCTDVLLLIYPDLTKASEAECVANYGPRSRKTSILPNLPTGFKQSRLCPRLRELIVSDTEVRSLGVYYALNNLPNLESLGVCYHIASGIKKHAIQGFSTFKLKQAYARGLTKDKVTLIFSACPNLETLYISSGSNLQFSFKLHKLSELSYLKSLTLESSSSLDLTGLKYISQLTELKLQVPSVDVGHIAETCPLLERLVMTVEPKRTLKLSNDRTKQTLFERLQELQVDSPVSLTVAELIVTEATHLRTFKVVRVKKLTDNVLSKWLRINPLLYLETWLLTYAHLTIASVQLLLSRCPKLSTLGRLSSWDVRSWETRRVQRTWQMYDVNLVVFSHKQEDVAEIIDATASSDEEE